MKFILLDRWASKLSSFVNLGFFEKSYLTFFEKLIWKHRRNQAVFYRKICTSTIVLINEAPLV